MFALSFFYSTICSALGEEKWCEYSESNLNLAKCKDRSKESYEQHWKITKKDAWLDMNTYIKQELTFKDIIGEFPEIWAWKIVLQFRCLPEIKKQINPVWTHPGRKRLLLAPLVDPPAFTVFSPFPRSLLDPSLLSTKAWKLKNQCLSWLRFSDNIFFFFLVPKIPVH